MMRLFLLSCMVLFLASCGQTVEKKKEPVKKYTIEQFLNTVGYRGCSFSPDESKILLSSDKTGIYNAYNVEISTGEISPLTKSEMESIMTISYFPEDERVLYMSDKGGNEIYHIYVRETDGTVKELTPGDKARALFHGWSDDEKSFFFLTNERDPRYMDLYEMDIEKYERKLVYKNEEGYDIGDVSRDKKYLSLSETLTRDNSELFLYDLQKKEIEHITPHEGNASFASACFSPCSKYFFYLSDEGREFKYVKKLELETKNNEVFYQADWDVMAFYFSQNGKYRVVSLNNDAKTEVEIYDNETNEKITLPNLPKGDISSISIAKSEEKMGFYLSGSNVPKDLYYYDLKNSTAKRLTRSLNPEINPDHLAEGKVVRYQSFDSLEIPAILYEPVGRGKDEKVKGLVWVHGGPGGQSRVGYYDLIQYLVNHGYAILAVNNRGSMGYGKTFYALDDRKHGQDDLKDCVFGKKYLVEQGFCEEGDVGIIGGSYGGYMTLAALAYEPEAFSVGVDIFGVANWLRTLKSIPAWWESYRNALYKELGDPEKDEEYLKKISPLFHAKNIVKPLIVLQGANDPRVLKVESDEIVEAVKSNQVPIEYVVFDDEGHGFRKKKNQIEGYEAILTFLNKHL